MNWLSLKMLAGAAVMVLGISAAEPAHAANVYLKNGQGYQQDWNTPDTWSDGQPVTSGNKYYVGRNASGKAADIKFLKSTQRKRTDVTVRTTANDVLFPGDQLIIDTSGTMMGKAISPINIPQLIIKGNGAVVSAFGPGSSITLAGRITFQDTPFFIACEAGRSFQLDSMLDGDGLITVVNTKSESTTATIDASTTFFTLTNDGNLFGGAFDIRGFTFQAKSSYALQNVSMTTINSDAIFATIPGVNIFASNMTLAIKPGGKVQLNSDVTLKKLIINGKEISSSSSADLNGSSLASTYPDQFSGNGRFILPKTKSGRKSSSKAKASD